MSIIRNKYNKIYSGIKVFLYLFFYLVILGFISSIHLPLNYYLELFVLRSCMIVFSILAFSVIYLLEKRSPKDFGIIFHTKTMKHLIIGLFLGAVSIILIACVLFKFGEAKLEFSWNQPIFSVNILYILLLFIVVGIDEELLIRGYMIHTLGRYNKAYIVYLIPALIFGALHLLNPHVNIVGFANIIIIGILFTYMTLKTGNIMMAIGFHITWNFFQGGIFGFNVSGTTTEAIYPVIVLRDNLLTGGDFGLEGSLLTTLVALLVGLFIYKLPIKKSANGLHKDSLLHHTYYKQTI